MDKSGDYRVGEGTEWFDIRRLFSSQLRINMVSGVAATLANMVVLAVAYPMYLHFLGYEQYGIWLVLATVLTFAQLGNLGIGHAVMKLVAEENGRNDLEAAQRYMASAVAILVVSGTVVFALILSLNGWIVGLFKLSQDNARTVARLLPYVAGLSIYVYIVHAVNAMLSGLGRMDLANYVQTGGRIVTVIVAGILLFSGWGITGLLIGNALSYLFIHATSLVLIRCIAPVRILRAGNFRMEQMKRLLRFGTGMFGSSLLAMFLSPFNKLMLARYAGITSIPVYEIAYTGSMHVRGLAEAGIRALMPEVSRLGTTMTAQAGARIREIHRRAAGLLALYALPSYGFLILGASLLLRLWLGHKFVASLPLAFQIALFGSLVSLACVPAYYVLLGLGHVQDCLISHALQSGMNVLLVFVLAWMDHDLSLLEVLVSTVIGIATSSAYIIVRNRRVLGHLLPAAAVASD